MENNKTGMVALKLDATVAQALGDRSVQGFNRAYILAHAIDQISQILTPEYMKPIMKLQGNRLGFRTDKDQNGGYPEAVVKNCLIEAVLTGVQPVGNHFNIIASNSYITKEGFGYLLDNIQGLGWSIIPGIPNMKGESALIKMTVKWRMNGGPQREQELDVAVKVNKFMGVDAVIGKATRKSRAWLHQTVTGMEIGEGDVEEAVVLDPTEDKKAELRTANGEGQAKIDLP